MKKIPVLILGFLIFVFLIGCKSDDLINDDKVKESINSELGNKANEEITSEDLEGLKELNIDQPNRVDLDGLEHAANLKSLTINDGLMLDQTSLDTIGELKSLEHLVIPNLSVKDYDMNDLDWLKGLTNLKELNIKGISEIDDISAMKNMKDLESLNLSENENITDFTPLRGLTNIKKLNLYDTVIEDYTLLKDMTNLEYLNLKKINTEEKEIEDQDWKVFENFTNLDTLHLFPSTKNDVNRLEEDDSEEVHIPDGELRIAINDGLRREKDYQPTKNDMRNLINLGHYLNDNNYSAIESLEGLENGVNLVSIHITNGEISDLGPLSELTNLRRLDLLDNNPLDDLTPLSELENLEALTITNSNIDDLTPLEKMKNMTYLNLERNEFLQDLTPLSQLKKLEFISIYNNDVSDVSPLEGLPNLDKEDIEEVS